MFRFLISSWSFALIIFSSVGQAYVGSVSAGTGGAGLAAVEASENPFGNPAGLAFLTGYYFTAGYGAQTQSAVGSNQDLAISLTDNMKDTIVPTSFSYVQSAFDPQAGDNTLRHDFKISFGNFIRPGLGFGLGILHEDDRLEATSYQQTNAQLGFLMAPNKDLGFAAVFNNLVPLNKDVPEIYRQKKTMEFGASWNFKKLFRFKGDVTSASNNSFGKPTVGGGMESYLNHWMIMRLGAQRNSELEANLYTAGVGFVGPRFAFQYAYENSPQKDSLTRHSVDLTVPIW